MRSRIIRKIESHNDEKSAAVRLRTRWIIFSSIIPDSSSSMSFTHEGESSDARQNTWSVFYYIKVGQVSISMATKYFAPSVVCTILNEKCNVSFPLFIIPVKCFIEQMVSVSAIYKIGVLQ